MSSNLVSKPHDYDAVVIGGGPAGSSVASLLSRWGRRVLLLEREVFPRHHVGESLLPSTVDLMKRIGVFEKVDRAGFVPKHGATYIWGKSREPWTIEFAEVHDERLDFVNKPDHSFQVDRSKFDKILLDHTRECGATVYEGCRATGVVQERNGVTYVSYLDAAGNQKVASCRICVDASGQNSLLGRNLELRRANPQLRNIAVYGYFRGGKTVRDLNPELGANNAGNILIAANDVGWIWYIPLADNRVSVGLVTDAAHSAEINRIGREEFYLDSIANTREIALLVEDAQMEPGPLRTQSDWSYICRRFQGPGYLLVGDAACFIDPILSSGVHLAMDGAVKAALAINTFLGDPELADPAMQWYEEEYQDNASNFLQMAEHWYVGHQSQTAWFATAQRLINPNRNLSIRQAFIYLSAGYATEAPHQNGPSMQPFGGWSSVELTTMYDHFAEVAPRGKRQQAGRRVRSKPASEHSDPTPTKNVETTIPSFESGVRYGPYMLEQDNALTPVFQIVSESDGLVASRHYMHPGISLILDQVDGRSTVQDIFGRLESEAGVRTDVDVDERQEFVNGVFRDLYDRKLMVPARGRTQRVAAARSARRPSRPAAPTTVGRNDPCPCGSGRKYKRCHGRSAS